MYLQITMDDVGCSWVQEIEAFQNLTAPRLEHFQINLFETPQIPVFLKKDDEFEFGLEKVIKIRYVFSVPDVMSSVTRTIYLRLVRATSQ